MSAPTLLAVFRRNDGHHCLRKQILQFQRLYQIGIEHQGPVADLDVGESGDNLPELVDAFLQHVSRTEHGGMILHGPLHAQPDLCGGRITIGMTQSIQSGNGMFRGICPQWRLTGAGHNDFSTAVGRRPAEYDQVQKGVRPQPVGPVDRNAGSLADRHQPRHHALRIVFHAGDDLAMIVGRYATHVVMHGRQHRNRLLGHVDARENPGGFGNPGETLFNHFGAQMLQVEMNVIFVLPDTATLADLDGHGPTDHVTGGEILGVWRVALHESLACGVGQVASFSANALGYQAPGTVNARRMELHEFHVLQR